MPPGTEHMIVCQTRSQQPLLVHDNHAFSYMRTSLFFFFWKPVFSLAVDTRRQGFRALRLTSQDTCM